MRIIISDTDVRVGREDILISDKGGIRCCKGCFSCWLKTPGICCIDDGYRDTGMKLSLGDELIIISRCLFGGYSTFVKNVLDRAISYVQPFFDVKERKMCHKGRYANRLKVRAVFYGEVDEEMKDTARRLVAANARNLLGDIIGVDFVCGREAVEI